MQREIKFRAWDRNRETMLYHSDKIRMGIWFDGEINIATPSFQFNDYFINSEKNNFELTQYTGLKDKNGKEIYENDILSYSTKVKKNGKVQFNSNRGQFEVFWKFGDICGFDKHWTENELEVVGNIYENQNLFN